MKARTIILFLLTLALFMLFTGKAAASTTTTITTQFTYATQTTSLTITITQTMSNQLSLKVDGTLYTTGYNKISSTLYYFSNNSLYTTYVTTLITSTDISIASTATLFFYTPVTSVRFSFLDEYYSYTFKNEGTITFVVTYSKTKTIQLDAILTVFSSVSAYISIAHASYVFTNTHVLVKNASVEHTPCQDCYTDYLAGGTPHTQSIYINDKYYIFTESSIKFYRMLFDAPTVSVFITDLSDTEITHVVIASDIYSLYTTVITTTINNTTTTITSTVMSIYSVTVSSSFTLSDGYTTEKILETSFVYSFTDSLGRVTYGMFGFVGLTFIFTTEPVMIGSTTAFFTADEIDVVIYVVRGPVVEIYSVYKTVTTTPTISIYADYHNAVEQSIIVAGSEAPTSIVIRNLSGAYVIANTLFPLKTFPITIPDGIFIYSLYFSNTVYVTTATAIYNIMFTIPNYFGSLDVNYAFATTSDTYVDIFVTAGAYKTHTITISVTGVDITNAIISATITTYNTGAVLFTRVDLSSSYATVVVTIIDEYPFTTVISSSTLYSMRVTFVTTISNYYTSTRLIDTSVASRIENLPIVGPLLIILLILLTSLVVIFTPLSIALVLNAIIIGVLTAVGFIPDDVGAAIASAAVVFAFIARFFEDN